MDHVRRRPRLGAAGAIVALAVVLQGCGGGGAAAPASTTDDAAHLEPGNRPVRFRLDTSVSQQTQDFLVETLGWAHLDLGDSGPLTLHVYSDEEHFVGAYFHEFGLPPAEVRAQLDGGQFVFATPGGHVWVYLPNFDADPPEFRRFAIFHEYFHTVQDWLAELRFQSVRPQDQSFVPRWLVEGSAEYLAVKASARRGLVVEGAEDALRVGLAKRSPDPLVAFETAGQATFLGGAGEAYTVGYVACERLATTYGADRLSHDFWVSLARRRNWSAAFTDAFGVSPAAFYSDFEAYRQTL